MFRFATVMLGIGAYVHALALYALRMNSLLMKINNSVDNCNFILSIQVALKTLVSVIPFLLIFFAGAIGARPLAPLCVRHFNIQQLLLSTVRTCY